MVYSNLCYKHPSVDIIKTEDNYHLLRCNNNQIISPGELILLEHSLASDNPTNLVNIIHQNIELYEWLCPRDIPYESRDITTSTLKISSNIFRSNGQYILGKYTSCINHSCRPNACVIHTHIPGYIIPITFMAVYAINTIEINDEIVIMYSPTVGHTANEYHQFSCNCSLSDDERSEISQEIKLKTTTNDIEGIYSSHRQLIATYAVNETIRSTPSQNSIPSDVFIPPASDTMRNTVITQALALLGGVYKVSDQQLLPLERFNEYISTHYRVDPRHASDNEKMNWLIVMMEEFETKYQKFLVNLAF